MDEGHTFLHVNGKRIEVVWHGPPPAEAPTLVFLHEGLGCVSMWRDFPQKLAAATGCGALVYSRFGYGRSAGCDLPRPLEFMHTEGLQVLPALLDVAGVKNCILVGHSDGGSIALLYAGGTPALPVRIRGLITEAPHIFREEVCERAIRDVTEIYRTGDLRQRLQKHHGENVDCAFWGWADTWLHADFGRWNLEEYLASIHVPLLVIQGEDDEYGMAAVEVIPRRAGAGAEVLLLPECGHAPHRDQEETTLAAMSRFIHRILSS